MDIVYYIVVILLSYVLPFAGIAKLFELVPQKEAKHKDDAAAESRAKELEGLKSWYAYIPLYNFYWWIKIVGRPVWHLIYLFIPIVNIFFIAAMAADLNKTFARFSFLDNLLAVVLPFVWFPYLGFSLKEKLGYIGPAFRLRKDFRSKVKAAAKAKDEKQIRKLEKEHPIPQKGIVREWADSIIFAVFAAHFIRLFLIEAYTIPTPSMEGSLLVGDFLFVSKAHYGSRAPMTPLSFPLLHNVFPITNGECYVKWPQWDYYRAPAIQKVKRYDPVVFNYPEGDTVIKGKEYGAGWYGQLKDISLPRSQRAQKREKLWAAYKDNIVIRPVDKRDHYIKRCVGVPGDKIEVKAGLLYVNDEKQPPIAGVQNEYSLKAKEGKSIDINYLKKNYQLNLGSVEAGFRIVHVHASDEVIAEIRKDLGPLLESSEMYITGKGDKDTRTGSLAFPYNHDLYPWNNDFYGPITIPKKGETIQLSMNNIALYERIIRTYEGNDLTVGNGDIKINAVPTNEYTFQMDYFWMMGDNRHNSADSRSWGFVPENHVVGKPLFVWLSMDGWSVRWNRLFMSATKK